MANEILQESDRSLTILGLQCPNCKRHRIGISLCLLRGHPDRFGLTLPNAILGDGMSTRLFLEVREAQGLAYAVDSSLSLLDETGLIG